MFAPARSSTFSVIDTVPITASGYFDTHVIFPASGTVELAWTYPNDSLLGLPGTTVYSRKVAIHGQLTRSWRIAVVSALLQSVMGAELLIATLEADLRSRPRRSPHPDALATYRSDGLSTTVSSPLAAVLPGTAAAGPRRDARLLRGRASRSSRAAPGTGLSGGALPSAEGVLIVLARLRRILSVDLDDGLVVVEPGVTNLAISRAVAPTHFYPPDPSSQIVCSIGGNIAENAGGAHCFKYGFTANYVVGLEVVLSDGTVVELHRDAPGYDLLGAFVGSEGTLGVATRIPLRVIPVPEIGPHARRVLRRHSRGRRSGQRDRRRAGWFRPRSRSWTGSRSSAAEQATGAGYRLDAGAALLAELDGPRIRVRRAL